MNAFRLGCIAAFIVAVGAAGPRDSDGFFPKPVSSQLPTYPERARAARVAGEVKLWFVPNEKGEVTQAQIISGNSMLRDAAVTTVRSWKFQPISIRPNVRYETEFVYVLEIQSKEGEPKLTVSMVDFRRVEVVSEFYVEALE